MSSKFSHIRSWTAVLVLAALERLEKSQENYNGRNAVATPAPSFLIGSSSIILAGNEDMYESLDGLAALECLKKQCLHFFLVANDLILFELAHLFH